MDKREIRFDGWTVNFDSGEISRDGDTHRLQDQPLQILDEQRDRSDAAGPGLSGGALLGHEHHHGGRVGRHSRMSTLKGPREAR